MAGLGGHGVPSQGIMRDGAAATAPPRESRQEASLGFIFF